MTLPASISSTNAGNPLEALVTWGVTPADISRQKPHTCVPIARQSASQRAPDTQMCGFCTAGEPQVSLRVAHRT